MRTALLMGGAENLGEVGDEGLTTPSFDEVTGVVTREVDVRV